MTGICQSVYKKAAPRLCCFHFVFPPVSSNIISNISSVCV